MDRECCWGSYGVGRAGGMLVGPGGGPRVCIAETRQHWGG